MNTTNHDDDDAEGSDTEQQLDKYLTPAKTIKRKNNTHYTDNTHYAIIGPCTETIATQIIDSYNTNLFDETLTDLSEARRNINHLETMLADTDKHYDKYRTEARKIITELSEKNDIAAIKIKKLQKQNKNQKNQAENNKYLAAIVALPHLIPHLNDPEYFHPPQHYAPPPKPFAKCIWPVQNIKLTTKGLEIPDANPLIIWTGKQNTHKLYKKFKQPNGAPLQTTNSFKFYPNIIYTTWPDQEKYEYYIYPTDEPITITQTLYAVNLLTNHPELELELELELEAET